MIPLGVYLLALLGSTNLPDLSATPEGVAVVLQSRAGKTLKGRLVPASDGRFGFSSVDFLETFEIDLGRIETLHFTDRSKDQVESHGWVAVELVSGDALRGKLLAVSPEAWSLDANGLGPLDLPTEQILSMESLGGEALVFNGPNGLAGWSHFGKKDEPWAAPPGRLVSVAPGAGIDFDLGLDQDRQIELELAWSNEPRFRVVLFTRSGKGSRKKVVVIEVWGQTLVAWSEVDERLGLVELAHGLKENDGLVLRLGIQGENAVFFDAEGGELGRLQRPARFGARLALINDGDSLELRSLLVLSGEAGSELHRLLASQIVGFDGDSRVFETTGQNISEEDVLTIEFDPPTEATGEAAESEEMLGAIKLVYSDGRHLTGKFVRLVEAGIELVPRWQTSTVTCAFEGLVKIEVLAKKSRGHRRSLKSFLVASTGEISGTLDSITPDGLIVWKPDIAEGAATLDPESVRRVVLNRKSAYFSSSRKWPHLMHLRSGDSFRCKLVSIGEDTTVIDTAFVGQLPVDNALIKAVEFNGRAMERFRKLLEDEPDSEPNNMGWGTAFAPRRETSEGFDAASLERALTLPRKYKRRGFKHLILVRTGDFLRTNVTSWSPAGLRYGSVISGESLVPQERIAALVWLAASALDGASSETDIQRARVVLDEETRLTLVLSEARDGELAGTSRVLGELSIPFSNILSIELDEESILTTSLFEDWILHPMKEPFPDEGAGSSPGATLALGDLAPTSAGHDLEGKDLSLSDYRGQVVLLDFWAHW